MDTRLERILQKVQKPARYTGGEYNQIIKNPENINVRFALCFPDVYEIGMSNLGMRILYGAINSVDDVWCERVFEPWIDMADAMRTEKIPLFALESGTALSEFDIIGFSVGYEMSYPGILNMLELAGLPLLSKERKGLSPIVFAGGTCMYNPEPIADFIDLAVVGEGEDADLELIELYKTAKLECWDKERFLYEASKIGGVYVPSLYDHVYDGSGALKEILPRGEAPALVRKRIVRDLNKSFYPVSDIVPSTEIVHDRTVLELFRGCIRGCRFCQAGFVYRPVRVKSAETLLSQAKEALLNSGYQEINLSSLSSSDYPGLDRLCGELIDFCSPRETGLSLPSLRADNFSMQLLDKIRRVRKSGLTFAPEAGSQRLRDVINKNVTEQDILAACRTAFEGGYSAVKLYFMLGLPTETDEDVLAISELAYKILDVWKSHAKNKSRGVKITVSTSCFVPKPHTPFQWEKQDSTEEFERKQRILKDKMRSKSISYSWHSPETSFIEAVLARGDRRLGSVLRSVLSKTGGLNAWDEHFSYEAWRQSFDENGIDPDYYAKRERSFDELLPWSVISTGVDTKYLVSESEKAQMAAVTPDCWTTCSGCGINSSFMVCGKPGVQGE